MAEKNTASTGFEKQIWDAACVLRGNMDASEYKNVVLGLIFLKYISGYVQDYSTVLTIHEYRPHRNRNLFHQYQSQFD